MVLLMRLAAVIQSHLNTVPEPEKTWLHGLDIPGRLANNENKPLGQHDFWQKGR
jgi:hypothetical protein